MADSAVGACDRINASVTVTNTGARDGDEVVQLYLQQQDASQPVPNVRLADFERVHVKAGASVSVDLQVLPQYHSVIINTPSIYDGVEMVEEGSILLSVGGGQPSASSLNATVNITSSSEVRNCIGLALTPRTSRRSS